MTQRQCRTCPWKVGADPHAIPDGYDVEKHRGLCRTIAQPGALNFNEPLRVMACHYTTTDAERPCVGWLHNQLGEGNNLALRVAVYRRRISADYELDGPQHERFEDTLPEGER